MARTRGGDFSAVARRVVEQAIGEKLTEEPLLEFGCHEGNRPMTLALRGARIREAKGEASDDWLGARQGGAKAVKAAKKRLEERREKARNEQ